MRWAVIIALIGFGCGSGAEPEQPMEFSHAVHVGKHVIDCERCHPGAKTAAAAGLPSLSICLSCHMKAQMEEGEEPSELEQKVRDIAAKGGPFRWVQVTRNDGHVYFSHRAHTRFAQMECVDCHGKVEEWAEAPTQPTPDLVDMGACMSCHREQDASNECKVCHR